MKATKPLPPSRFYRKMSRDLIGVRSKMTICDTPVLSRLYTPGVGASCIDEAMACLLPEPGA